MNHCPVPPLILTRKRPGIGHRRDELRAVGNLPLKQLLHRAVFLMKRPDRFEHLHQICQIIRFLKVFLHLTLKLVQQHAKQRKPLIKLGNPRPLHDLRGVCPRKNLLHFVLSLIFIIKLIVRGKFLDNLFVVKILCDKRLIYSELLLLTQKHHGRQVLPPSRRHVGFAADGGLHAVKVIFLHIQIGCDSAVNPLPERVLLPRRIVSLHLHQLHSVHRHHIKLPHRLIVLRRVSGSDNHPAVWNAVPPKDLVLQKLQHRGRQRLRHTVNLVEKQDALLKPGLLHHLINRSDNLTHRIF